MGQLRTDLLHSCIGGSWRCNMSCTCVTVLQATVCTMTRKSSIAVLVTRIPTASDSLPSMKVLDNHASTRTHQATPLGTEIVPANRNEGLYRDFLGCIPPKHATDYVSWASG